MPTDGMSRQDKSRLLAAQMQHDWSMRIRKALRAKKVTLKQYAALPENPGYDRTVKMLRGDVIMRLEDVALAQVVLGAVLVRADPSPPT